MSERVTPIDRMLAEAADPASYARAYAGYVARLLEQLDFSAVARLAELLHQARIAGRTVFLAGNGGSATTASHWANDLMHGAEVPGVPGLRAVSLVDNVAVLTAIANDRA